jgi:hypothetical protein
MTSILNRDLDDPRRKRSSNQGGSHSTTTSEGHNPGMKLLEVEARKGAEL